MVTQTRASQPHTFELFFMRLCFRSGDSFPFSRFGFCCAVCRCYVKRLKAHTPHKHCPLHDKEIFWTLYPILRLQNCLPPGCCDWFAIGFPVYWWCAPAILRAVLRIFLQPLRFCTAPSPVFSNDFPWCSCFLQDNLYTPRNNRWNSRL